MDDMTDQFLSRFEQNLEGTIRPLRFAKIGFFTWKKQRLLDSRQWYTAHVIPHANHNSQTALPQVEGSYVPFPKWICDIKLEDSENIPNKWLDIPKS